MGDGEGSNENGDKAKLMGAKESMDGEGGDDVGDSKAKLNKALLIAEECVTAND